MATTTAAARKDLKIKEYTFIWEGVDRNNRQVRGESRAASETVVITNLRRQGIRVNKIKRQTFRGGRKVTERDIAFFTRQFSTMLKAGVPLLQSFDIVARGHSNARFSRLMMDIKNKVETGSSLSQAFREHPAHFDPLYCNLVAAGETAGMLDAILDRLATYKEKILAIKSKIKSALFYPISVMVVAVVVVWVIMVFVIPAFKSVFSSFGAELPLPTQIVINVSDFFVAYWWLGFIILVASIIGFTVAFKRSMRSTASRSRFLSSAAFSKRRRSHAGRGPCRPCSLRACRSSNRWMRSAALPATQSSPLAPSGSRWKSAPARASRTRWATQSCSRRWCSR